MQIPQIQIAQTLGQIGLRYQPAQLQIHTQPADMNLHTQADVLDIQRTPGQLQIDQTEAFSQEGLMPSLELDKSQAQNAKQMAVEAVQETSKAGEQILKSKNPKQALNEWLSRYESRTRGTEIGLLPSPFSVHIHYQPSQLSTHIQLGYVSDNVVVHRPQMQFTNGSVQAYLQQVPSITITPPPVGQLIDLKL